MNQTKNEKNEYLKNRKLEVPAKTINNSNKKHPNYKGELNEKHPTYWSERVKSHPNYMKDYLKEWRDNMKGIDA